MISQNLWPGLVQPLNELRARTQLMLKATAVDTGPIREAGTEAVITLSDAAQDRSPLLTGTLAASHTAEWNETGGRVFIDPNTINPVFGGKPAEYGLEVHERKPWIEDTYEQDAPLIISDYMDNLMHRWNEIW